jgi:tripartite-type tricarboxylate transporter receptor subunit TctC
MESLNRTLARLALACLIIVPASVAITATAARPTKPVRLIVPFSPGGGADIIARALGQKLSETFGQQFIVDGFVPAHSTPEEYRKRLARDVARWKEVVKRGKNKIDVIG